MEDLGASFSSKFITMVKGLRRGPRPLTISRMLAKSFLFIVRVPIAVSKKIITNTTRPKASRIGLLKGNSDTMR